MEKRGIGRDRMSKSEEVNTSSAESDSDDEPLAKVCSSPLYYITEATIIKESNINSNGGQYKKEFLLLEWHVNFISPVNSVWLIEVSINHVSLI